MARSKISEAEIATIIKAEIANADGQAQSALSIARASNMEYYQGEPFGNEIEGRSSVVSFDVMETIEWILPTLIRIFTSGEDVVSFQPQQPEDEKFAKIATDYVSFIWNEDNRGFLNTYSWFKDALLQKNGILKVYWDDSEKTQRKRYKGLADNEFASVVNQPDTEVSEHTANEIQGPLGTDGQPTTQNTHDLVVTRKIKGGKVCIKPVPPEEFLISKDARSIEDARFVGHKRQRPISDLRAEGYDKAKLDELSGDDSQSTEAEQIARNTVEDSSSAGSSGPLLNEAMRMVWVTEGYIKIDVDGDGIAEMRKVLTAGPDAVILSNDAWDTPRPFASLTPIIMPHRFWGLAVADLIKDIQLIKSTILRQYLDNLYLSNNQREQVVEANIIEPSEVLSSKPGQKIRVKNGEAVFPIIVPNIGAQALEGLNYVDQIRENRTGVSARTQGLGTDPMHDTASGERQMMSAALGKVELIARVFAETGVRDIFRMILRLVVQYQNTARMVKLEGQQQFQNVDPSQWNADMDVRVSVGLGMGDRDQQLMHAQLLGAAQEKLHAMGMLSPNNVKESMELLVNGMGLKGVERFGTFPQDPKVAEQPMPAPQPKGAGQQQNPQLEMAKVQAKGQADSQVAQIRAQSEAQVTQIKSQAQAQVDTAHNQMEAQRDTLHNQQQMQLEAEKAKLNGAIQVLIAHINNAGKIEAAEVEAKYNDGSENLASERSAQSA
jgi:hypothetical protein